jgi:L-serine dehydratase
MSASVFDIFKVGIGPSSSHTVGPMRAANHLVAALAAEGTLAQVEHLRIELFGSLGATGRGHGTDRAVMAGLAGETPEDTDPSFLFTYAGQVAATNNLRLTSGDATKTIVFSPECDIIFAPFKRLAYHPNALTFTLTFDDGTTRQATYYSVGGGFIVPDDGSGEPVHATRVPVDVPYPFATGAELVQQCMRAHSPIPEIVLANEIARGRTGAQVQEGLLHLWQVMTDCIELGCRTEGTLPGGLGVQRRAKAHLAALLEQESSDDSLAGLDWVSLWALAVNEQNAAGGRIVTAPTNGAAGIIPAVLRYAMTRPRSGDNTVVEFLLAAGAIGAVFQATASISGAEVGCQGEVGAAASMAAAGLCQVMGGTVQQVVNAAEIGLEHHLGLTCDPIGGLVQVPCIERNAVGATTAITAARMALRRETQMVSLDKVLETMMATGADMTHKYKETALGGLALSFAAC